MTPIHFLNHSALVHITDPDEHCQKCWVIGKFYEAQRNGLLSWAYTNIPHNGIYIDIGANIGNHSLFMWKVLNAKKVISIEVEGKHYDKLFDNLRANGITCEYTLQNAVSDFNGSASLVYDNTPADQGGAMMGKLVEDENGSVDSLRLDSFINEYISERVTWMKLDIEGSELKALQGGLKFIADNKPQFISCECMDTGNKTEIDILLTPLGYSIVSPQLNHTPTFVWKHLE